MTKKTHFPLAFSSKLQSSEFALSRSIGLASAPKDYDWLAKSIPCQAACPAGTDIPGYLEATAQGDYEEAYRINLRDNVFPAVLGRVCTRPCEPMCRHGWEGLGDPVAICFAKRSASDFLKNEQPMLLDPLFPATGKRIGIIGAGAGGLAAARDLKLFGHEVVVYEKYEQPGGLMIQGIPAFRLPRAIVKAEIEQIAELGIDIRCGIEVGRDVTMEKLLEEHHAVIIATGALKPSYPDLPGLATAGVEHGLPFLQKVNQLGDGEVGENVVVVGGGFTAVDCARMAKRLGAKTVKMVYRRSEKEMYVTGHELVAMEKEGISFEPLTTPVGFFGGDNLESVDLVRTQLEAQDAPGRAVAVSVEGSAYTEQADTVLLGTGQRQAFDWIDEELALRLLDEAGEMVLQNKFHTRIENLFVTGDAATGPGSLIEAIGHARECAKAVDQFVMGEQRLMSVCAIEEAQSTGRTREMDEWPRSVMPELSVASRSLLAEVEEGLAESEGRKEASRCYLCHYKYEIDNDLCIYCDRCLKVMPVKNCIVRVSSLNHDDQGCISGYTESQSSRDYNLLYIDQNECIRCGACQDVCPVECISLQKVSSRTIVAPSSS